MPVVLPAQNSTCFGALDTNEKANEFRTQWYAKQLEGLHEPCLFGQEQNPGTESYRFLYLRTFHHPISVRIDVQADGSATVTARMTSGAGGYDPGKLLSDNAYFIPKERVEDFRQQVSKLNVWYMATELPPKKDVIGTDGAQWVFEAVRNGRYHVVDRWSPRDGDYRKFFLWSITDLGKFNLPPDETY